MVAVLIVLSANSGSSLVDEHDEQDTQMSGALNRVHRLIVKIVVQTIPKLW